MKPAIILAAVLALTGCYDGIKPESSVSIAKDFNVERLFTVDGCTVYRFKDYGHSRYFTNCHGSTSWQESCGKNCSRPVEVEGGAE